MTIIQVLVLGFAATAVLSSLVALGQGLRLTRIDLPFILGTIVTANRDRAMLYGAGLNFLIGWAFAFVYLALFDQLHRATAPIGAAIGLVHGAFLLLVGLPLLPGLHPRMASERSGPTPTRLLQPPGFLGLHYGYTTPLVTLVAHVAYGAILGAFYTIPPHV